MHCLIMYFIFDFLFLRFDCVPSPSDVAFKYATTYLLRLHPLSLLSPMKLLRQLPELNAKKIISLTLELMPNIPEDLYDMLVRHPFDPTIFDVILPECENEEHDGSSEKS